MDRQSLILLVDDDRMNLKKAQEILVAEQYKIAAALSGEQAIKYIENNVPDLVLLDINMPGIDGFETFQRIRELPNGATVPIIFLTAEDDISAEIKGFDMGADDFIRKPFVSSIVLKRVKRSIESAKLRNSLEHQVEHQTRKVDEKRKELDTLSFEIIQTLAATIDTKDMYTKGHSSRVAEYSVMLAKRLGWDENRVENLRMMALLHDVGKISIPDRVLNKPGRLEDDEFEIIKSHTVYGYSILQGISRLDKISKVARHHHERYDGKGYPDQLAGEEIELEARVVGIADSYDAMSSDRVYRKALSKEIIRHEFEKGRGTQFDPELVDVFLELFEAGQFDAINEEASQQANVVDLSDYIAEITDAGNTNGAIMLKHDELVKLYAYLKNNNLRHGMSFVTILISLSSGKGTVDEKHLQRAMDAMEYSIVQCLRSTDLTSRISNSQHIVVLTEADEKYISMVVERIFSGYYKNCLYAEIKPSYEIGQSI
ncbi:MAG: response regulator [Eubacteriales bacterium]|nr:response regulator [Eubacteriales bacterium]